MKALFAMCVLGLVLCSPIKMYPVYSLSATEQEGEELLRGILEGMGSKTSFGSVSRCFTDIVDACDDVAIGLADLAGGTPKDDLHAVENFYKALTYVLGSFQQCFPSVDPADTAMLEKATNSLANIYSFDFVNYVINDVDVALEIKNMETSWGVRDWRMIGYYLGAIVAKLGA